VARTRDGYDVSVRVLVVRGQGYGHLNILRKIATGSCALLSNNHTLPLLSESQFGDIIFGIFPRVGWRMEEAFNGWPKNSVGDVLDMLMQALEVGHTSIQTSESDPNPTLGSCFHSCIKHSS
jgi:hypothetical protein